MFTNIKESTRDDSTGELLKKPAFLNKTARKWVHAPIYQQCPEKAPNLNHWIPLNRLNENHYPFSKLDKHVEIVEFDRKQYDEFNLGVHDWTYYETELLMKMCKKYELKFFVVQDRYNEAIAQNGEYKLRNVEELKHRFYYVDRIVRKEIKMEPEDQLPPAYDIHHETQRKLLLQQYYYRTVEEIAEEAFLTNELKKIQSKQKEMDKVRFDTNDLLLLADEYIRNKSLEKDKPISKSTKASTSASAQKSSGSTTAGREGYNDDKHYGDNFNPRSSASGTSRKRISAGSSSIRKKKQKSTPTSTNQPPPKSNVTVPSQPAPTNTTNTASNANTKSGGIGSRTRIVEPFRNAGVHMRSQKMIVTHNIGMKRVKMLEQVCIDLGLENYPPPTEEIYGMLVELRSLILTLFDLKHVLGVTLYDNHMLRNKHHPDGNKEISDPSITAADLSSPAVPAGENNEIPLPETDKSFSNILDSMVATAVNYQRKRKSSSNKWV